VDPPDPESARQSFMLLLNQYPGNAKVPDALYKLGRVHFIKGNSDRAREFLNARAARVPGKLRRATGQRFPRPESLSPVVSVARSVDPIAAPETLRITEIFYSLQGEARTVGCPTVFVRLTGCPLRCGYCDTEYAFHGGELQTLAEIGEAVAGYAPAYVTVTGGEPLAQPNCLPLLTLLCDAGYEVSLETSGAMPVGDVDPRVVKVLDLKTPGSGEVGRNLYENLPLLSRQ
jgi:hypothetical protein